jgi:hypothetical protein
MMRIPNKEMKPKIPRLPQLLIRYRAWMARLSVGRHCILRVYAQSRPVVWCQRTMREPCNHAEKPWVFIPHGNKKMYPWGEACDLAMKEE